MEKNDLEFVLNDWNFWNKGVPDTIPRSACLNLGELYPDIVLAVQGVRRCGKSTALQQIMTTKKLNVKNCFFVNFEDPRLASNLDETLLEDILQFAIKKSGSTEKKYFFFDEIQNVKNWEKWLHSQLERSKYNFFVITGSNATLLSGELSSTLTGRHFTLELFPFDFQEFRIVYPDASLEKYFKLGGMPRALTVDRPQELLREYFTDIVERDVRRHVAARNTITLSQTVKAIFDSAGSELSLRNLSKALDISTDTVSTYVAASEVAYLTLSCPYFSFSERQRIIRQKKYYPIDTGLCSAVSNSFQKNFGKNFESVVMTSLRRKHREVYYWKGKGEVDFVTNDHSGITPYQVTWEDPKPRHFEAFDEFYKKFPNSNKGTVITPKVFLTSLLTER